MDNIIVLSSDDDNEDEDMLLPASPTKPEFASSKEVDCNTDDDFDYGVNNTFSPERDAIQCASTSKQFEEDFGTSFKNKALKTAARVVHDLSDSDPDEAITMHKQKVVNSSDDELPDINIYIGTSKNPPKQRENPPIESYGTSPKDKSPESKLDKNKKREELKHRKQIELSEKARQRQAVQEERERKKREAAHAKALKQANAEIERSKKPGECLKLITTILDPGLLNADYSGELLTALRTSEAEYKVEECAIPCSVTWERRIKKVHVDDNMEVQKSTVTQSEQFVLIVWMWNKLIEIIHENSLQRSVEEISSLLPGREITIVIFGLEDYFRLQKNQKRRDVRSEVTGSAPQKRKAKAGSLEETPQVSRGDVEYALAELQVFSNISHRCINNKTDMGNLVCQFTKAIAEAPFKREKHEKNAERLDWYALADSKDCVVVDANGNGSFQLWQRQLCQYPLASRETSEAIASVYPSPICLLQAYENCSTEREAQLLLEDIPVRRGPGPLASTRRIGPQLSKKIHTFFTTFDENCLISQD